MAYTVMLSPGAQKYFDALDTKRAEIIRRHLKELERDPFKQRASCEIDKIAGSNRPPMYRLRIGDLRAMYFVEEQAIFITDIFSKKRDSVYRENL